MRFGDPFAVANVVGLLAFAIAGALKAADADLDLFGVVVLGVVTALGGGTTRDVLVGRLPTSLDSVGDVTVALVGVAIAVIVVAANGPRLRDNPLFLFSDALGLAAFAATGALVGTSVGLSPFGVVALATVTAVGGGSIADILLGRVPVVLREDFYATPALAGGVSFWALSTVGAPAAVSTLVCTVSVLGLRGLALTYDWQLPTV
ncbi:trimeric intracellular cation channel family protein [Salinigranum halophilum]|uniref:trimeric intracellular cation channel family protein n=1 Tax=Salinigranum halophilum TaxID=2565931 RepID=UPI0010A8CD24|nr:trimeric intracellular cation channel family protein [Salinigranum halophilum]